MLHSKRLRGRSGNSFESPETGPPPDIPPLIKLIPGYPDPPPLLGKPALAAWGELAFST
jgi:hypothetical protein